MWFGMKSMTMNSAPSVSDVARVIDRAMRDLGEGWVEGEVSAITDHRSGHVYLTLADENANIEACIWKGRRHQCEPLPEQGDLVKAHYERVDFYAPRGSTKLVIDRMEPTGEGELLRRRAETLSRLQTDGLCDPARRRPLVAFPRRVGVIAAYAAKGDVIEHLRKRFPPQDIAFCPAAVQGVEAVGSIIDALGRLQSIADVDVIIIARGGGSVADLVPFDDERLCRAIATSRVPVVTSIGHTKDRPNCDHVSAAYAAVPAKAAELAIPHAASELLEEFAQLRTALDAVPDRVRQRGAAVGELWEQVRPRQRLTELVDDVEAAAQLLASRAEAGWRRRDADLVAAGRDLDAAGSRLARARSLDDLREELHAAATAFFSGHLQTLDEHADALGAASRRIPRPASLDVFAGKLDSAALFIRRKCHDYGRAFDRQAETAATAVRRRLSQERRGIDAETKPLRPAATRVLASARRDIEAEVKQLRPAVARGLAAAERTLDSEASGLRPAADRVLARSKERVDALAAVIDAKDFRRHGWVLASDEQGQAVRTVAALQEGDPVHLRFADGEAAATVDHVRPHDEGEVP
jgi:exodeoxyribonuclease VII large subunit